MLILVTGGSVFLSKLLQGKFDIKDAQNKAADLGLQSQLNKPKASLEEELQKLKAKIDLDDYSNKPVPRPEDD
ncbi:hypothetical protein COCOBI_10-2620 [Coccomyxa sp. Obi]|nr:hypothetical protein COCOBI_10-2620 [Coccomyxa sp. Obi]